MVSIDAAFFTLGGGVHGLQTLILKLSAKCHGSELKRTQMPCDAEAPGADLCLGHVFYVPPCFQCLFLEALPKKSVRAEQRNE